jgi:hypothetical protein
VGADPGSTGGLRMTTTIDLIALLSLALRRGGRASVIGFGPMRLLVLCSLEEVDQRRNLRCPAYDRCLDVACRHGWTSWTCDRCLLFTSPSPRPRLADWALPAWSRGPQVGEPQPVRMAPE